MRVRVASLLAVAALAAVVGASAAPNAGPRTFGTRGDVLRIASDGTRVAVVTKRGSRRCGAVVVFNAANRRVERFEIPSQCPGSDVGVFGPDVVALAIAGTQLAWMISAGGNTQELELRAATLGQRATYQLSFATNGAGAAEEIGGQWLTHLMAAGPLLVYSSFTLCDVSYELDRCFEQRPTPPFDRELITRPSLISVDGRRQRQIAGDLDAVRPVAATSGRIALLPLDLHDPVRVVDARGRAVGSVRVPNAPDVSLTQKGGHTPYALDGRTLVVLRRASLEVYEVPSGAHSTTLQLPVAFRGGTLVGTAGGLIALHRRGKVYVVRTSDGASVSYSAPSARAGIVDAAITPHGLFYAYNVRSATATGRVQFVPLTRVRAGF